MMIDRVIAGSPKIVRGEDLRGTGLVPNELIIIVWLGVEEEIWILGVKEPWIGLRLNGCRVIGGLK